MTVSLAKHLKMPMLVCIALCPNLLWAAAPVADSKPLHSNQCTSDNPLTKTLSVTSFQRSKAAQASAGRLIEADYELPKLLTEQLSAHKVVMVNSRLEQGLPSATQSNDALLSQQVQQLAHKQQSQLVLTGKIIDISMPDSDRAYAPGLYDRFLNGLFDFIEVKNRFDKRERLFRFEIDLRDGITGESVFSKNYDTYGIWNTTAETGFSSPAFWKTDYGQQVKGLVKKASKDIAQAISCQPYIAAIDSRPGQVEVMIQGGANHGLHAGDSLTLYQLIRQGSETDYQLYHTRLVNRNMAVELKEVYPNHSLAVIASTTYLNGQYLAVAP